MNNLKNSSIRPVLARPIVVEEAGDLTPAVLEDMIQRSLANTAIHVTNVQVPQGLGGINDQYGSELTKIDVTVEEDGIPRVLHLIIKEALQSKWAWSSVILNTYYFCRETFWFNTALPELMRLVNAEQAAALVETMPKVHYAYCNYQPENPKGCLLNNAIACCCCVVMTKPKEKGIILMENLKEGSGDTYVDMKEIVCTSGGGVRTAHMRMLLEAMAHFHGAWMVWLRSGDGMGDMTRNQMMNFYKQYRLEQWKLFRKASLKSGMSYYTVLAKTENMQTTQEKIQAFIDSAQSVDQFTKILEYSGSNFKTMCHNDQRSTQIMFCLNEDGTPKRVKILDYASISLGHPALDIWPMVYSATDAEYRREHLEVDLQAYYAVLSTYMDTKVDYAVFRQEVEERRAYGVIIYGSFDPFLTLSPEKLPHPVTESDKFKRVTKEMLIAEDTEEDHPDVREIRRRIMGNLKEMEELNLI